MRTTITLDDDVASSIERLQEQENKSFKEIVNELLREGIGSKINKSKKGKKSPDRYETPVLKSGPPLYRDIDNTAEILSVVEGENYS